VKRTTRCGAFHAPYRLSLEWQSLARQKSSPVRLDPLVGGTYNLARSGWIPFSCKALTRLEIGPDAACRAAAGSKDAVLLKLVCWTRPGSMLRAGPRPRGALSARRSITLLAAVLALLVACRSRLVCAQMDMPEPTPIGRSWSPARQPALGAGSTSLGAKRRLPIEQARLRPQPHGVLWVDRAGSLEAGKSRVIAYLEGDVIVDYNRAGARPA